VEVERMASSDVSQEVDVSADIAAAHERREAPWWLILLQGMAGLVIGVLLVTQPNVTILTLVVFLGVFWLVGGIFDLVGVFLEPTSWGWRLVSAILGILAGLLIVRNPLWAGIAVPTTLVYLLAIIGILVGAVNIGRALTGGGWGVGILGFVSCVLGLILLTRPLLSLGILVYLAGFWAIAGGIAMIVGAFWLRGNRGLAMSGPAGGIV
jgi:uncharacterized membrane protein HdeD (DUF308 family)